MKKSSRFAASAEYLALPLELVQFLWARKLFWLIPMVIAVLLVGLLTVLASSSPIAPFIYTLF